MMRLSICYNKVRAMRRWLLTLMLLLTLAPVSAKVRIMLISDPHVMGPGLLINKGEAWDEAIYLDRKLNDYSLSIYDEAIAIALREKPDLFLISGDLTKDGEWLSHQYVVKKLQELKETGIKAFVIPGNHDMGTFEALYFDGADSYRADTINTSQFAEIYKDFGYGDDVEREPTTLTWCCEPVDGLMLIGIDSGHDNDKLNGVVSDATLTWVCERAKKATAEGKQVLAMMHHTLFPHVTYAERFSSTYAVKLGVPNDDGTYIYAGSRRVRNRLADAGVGVVFSGHVHASDIAKDANQDLTRTIHDICTASCDAYPNPYRLLTLNDDGTMSIRTHYISELPGIDDFAALAEERMTIGLKNLVYQSTHNDDAAALFAEIFKIHVCGNEPEDPRCQEFIDAFYDYLPRMMEDQQINAFLTLHGVSFDQLTLMVHSLLEDKSNYGDADRESLDDDLNTTIPVSIGEWTGIRGVKHVEGGMKSVEGGKEGWYTLQGVRIAKPSRKGVYIHNGKLILH